MNKKILLIAILGIFFAGSMTLAATQINLYGTNLSAASRFRTIAAGEGLGLGIYNHFGNNVATATQLCALTAKYYTQLGLDKPYTVYVKRTASAYVTCGNDHNYIWSSEKWVTQSACSIGSYLTTVTCAPAPSAPVPPTPPTPPTTPPTTSNLILNPNLENNSNGIPTSWNSGSWGTNDAVFSYPVSGFSGNGASVTINNYTSGDAKWYFNNVAVTGGKYYVFSDEFMSTAQTQVIVQFHNTNGTLSYLQIGTPAASANWQSFQAGFNVPLGVDTLTIFHLLYSAGTLTTDNYSLVQTANPNAFSKGMVSLNFDDGWQTNFTTAIPILNAAGFKSTQYIITGSIGDTADGYMTLPELKTIYQQGHDIEAHTRTHVDLTLPTSDLQSEIVGSKNDLLADGFSPINSIAYPYGRYNATIQSVASGAGFVGGRTVDLGFNDKATNPFALNVQIVERGGVCGTDNAPATTLDQVKNWIDTAATTNTWLTLVFHQTDNDTTNCYGDTPAMLQSIVDYLKTSNVDVVTNSQALQKMK